MTSTASDTTVLIAGASGNLGRRMVREVATAGGRVRAGVRGGSEHPDAGALADTDGVEVVELDLTEPGTMGPAVDGADVVISTVQGGPDLLVDGQGALATAALAAGVRRIFPSDFSVDFTDIPDEEHLFFAWRKQGQQAITASGLAQTNTYNGAFLEMLLPQRMFVMVDRDADLIHYWGSADQIYDFTSMDDTARFVAAAALDPTTSDGPLRLAGDSLTPTDIAKVASEVYGREFTLDRLGDLDELNAEIARLQKAAPDDPFSWVGLQYSRAMASGVGRLHGLDLDRYPGVVPSSALEFLSHSATKENP